MKLRSKKVMGIPVIYLVIIGLVSGGSAAMWYGMSNPVDQSATVERPVTLEIWDDSGSQWALTSAWTGTGHEWNGYTNADDLEKAQVLKLRSAAWDGQIYDGYIEINVTGIDMVTGEIDAAFIHDTFEDTYSTMSVTFEDDHYILKTDDSLSFNGNNENREVAIYWNVYAYSGGSPYLCTAVLTPT